MSNRTNARTLALLSLGLFAGCSAAADDHVGTTSQGLIKVQVTLPVALGGQTELTTFAPPDEPTSKRAMGLLPPQQLPTPEVRPAGILREAPQALPASIDLSQWSTTPGDQGPYGSCSSWASGYTSLGWWFNKTGQSGNPFNPMFLYGQLVPSCNDGSTLESPMDLLQKEGNDTLAEFPKTSCTHASAAQISAAAPYKISGYQQIDLSGGVEQAIKTALAGGKPITLGILVYHELMNATSSNYLIGPPAKGSAMLGGHAITAFKYDAQGVWFENSWGSSWGKGGWAELSWAFINGSSANDGPYVNDAVSIDGLASAPTPPTPPTPPPPAPVDAGTPDSGAVDAGAIDSGRVTGDPTVDFTAPTNGGVLPAFTSSTITVTTADPGATVASADLTVVGPYGTSVHPMTSSDGAHWSAAVQFGMAGSRSFSVTVTDSNGKTASASETIQVAAAGAGPTVQFTAPASGATLPAFTAATITAAASDPGVNVTSASFTVVGPYGTITQAMTSTDGTNFSISVEFGKAASRSLSVTITDANGKTATTTETIAIQ